MPEQPKKQREKEKAERSSKTIPIITAGIVAAIGAGMFLSPDEKPKKEAPKERTWHVTFEDGRRAVVGDIDGKMPIDYIKGQTVYDTVFLAKEHEQRLKFFFGPNYTIMNEETRRAATDAVRATQYLKTQLQRELRSAKPRR